MANHRLLPSDDVLLRWVGEGLTHQQIADRVEEETGHRVARATVSAALSRAGKTKTRHPRFEREVPWRVRQEHVMAYPIRNLRLLGRRRMGLGLGPGEDQRLDNWLQLLHEEELVVAYAPHLDEGAIYVRRGDVDPEWIDGELPVVVRRLTAEDVPPPDLPY